MNWILPKNLNWKKLEKKISEENNDLSKQLNKARAKAKLNILETIKEMSNNIYDWFLNLF